MVFVPFVLFVAESAGPVRNSIYRAEKLDILSARKTDNCYLSPKSVTAGLRNNSCKKKLDRKAVSNTASLSLSSFTLQQVFYFRH